jgi:hypothetical protein
MGMADEVSASFSASVKVNLERKAAIAACRVVTVCLQFQSDKYGVYIGN